MVFEEGKCAVFEKDRLGNGQGIITLFKPVIKLDYNEEVHFWPVLTLWLSRAAKEGKESPVLGLTQID